MIKFNPLLINNNNGHSLNDVVLAAHSKQYFKIGIFWKIASYKDNCLDANYLNLSLYQINQQPILQEKEFDKKIFFLSNLWTKEFLSIVNWLKNEQYVCIIFALTPESREMCIPTK